MRQILSMPSDQLQYLGIKSERQVSHYTPLVGLFDSWHLAVLASLIKSTMWTQVTYVDYQITDTTTILPC